MENRTYNGWTNYETWCVNLWIGNEQGEYLYWRDETDNAWHRAEPTKYSTKKEKACIDLADRLKEYFEENNPINGQCSVYNDMLGAAFSEVNWDEIANGMLEGYEEEKEETEA